MNAKQARNWAKRMSAILVIAVLMLTTLTACSGKPKNAADVMAKWTSMNADNYRVKGDIEMSIAMTAESPDIGGNMNFDIPVEISLDIETANKNAQGEVEMKMSMFGETDKEDIELFYDGENEVMYTGSETIWTKSEIDDTTLSPDKLTFTGESNHFKNASFEFDKDANEYHIAAKLGDIAKREDIEDMLSENETLSDDMFQGLDKDTIIDSLTETTINYIFDAETCRLKTVSMEEFEIAGSQESDGYKIKISLTMSFKLKFDKYGEIDEIEIPLEVSESAIEKSDADDSFGGFDDDESFLIPDNQTSQEPQSQQTITHVGSDYTGQINGSSLSYTSKNDFSNTFEPDGWQFNKNDDGQYSFGVVENSKYPEATLYLYNTENKVFESDIRANGFTGYSISCEYEKNKPNMSWNGITFGASVDDIKSAYGEPTNQYNGEIYQSLTYELTDYAEIEFYIYTPSEIADSGLQKVDLRTYNF